MDATQELVAAFSEAVPAALRELAGVESIVRETRPAGGGDRFDDVLAIVRLTMSGGEGRLVLCVPNRTASELARRVLAGTVDHVPEEMVRDCMGEVANVVAGQAKALLVGRPSHFTLSTPVVRAGGRAEGTSGCLIRFESDAGEFGVPLLPPA